MSVSVLRWALCAATCVAAMPALAQSAGTMSRIGALECAIAGGPGFIITSSKALSCTFKPTRGPREHYVGTIRKFGLDLGVTQKGRVVWAVLAPSSSVRSGALAGDYVGVSAEATVGAGVQANALVGGFNKSFNLQPLSVGGQTGLNIAAGVSELTLEPSVPRARRAR